MSYYFEGYDAAQAGLWYWDCPYRIGTAAHTYWLNGHGEARKLRWVNVVARNMQSRLLRGKGICHEYP